MKLSDYKAVPEISLNKLKEKQGIFITDVNTIIYLKHVNFLRTSLKKNHTNDDRIRNFCSIF